MTTIQMTMDDAEKAYIAASEQPYFKGYRNTVNRFQSGFLADGVTRDVDVAFARAVDCAERLLPVMRGRWSQ